MTAEEKAAYHQNYWRSHWHYQGPAEEDLPPGQYVACCGTWVWIDALPLACPSCGRVFSFEEETDLTRPEPCAQAANTHLEQHEKVSPVDGDAYVAPERIP